MPGDFDNSPAPGGSGPQTAGQRSRAGLRSNWGAGTGTRKQSQKLSEARALVGRESKSPGPQTTGGRALQALSL